MYKSSDSPTVDSAIMLPDSLREILVHGHTKTKTGMYCYTGNLEMGYP
jgi:hypothetical protein